MTSRSLPVTIVLTLVIALIIGLVATVIPLIDKKGIKYIGGLIPSFAAMNIGIENGVFIENTIMTVLFTVINVVAGNLIIKFKDVK